MIEMQSKDNRRFTNQLPKWAIIFHIVFISIFSIIGIAFLIIAITSINENVGMAITMFGISCLFCWLGWFSYKNLRNYLDYIFKIEIRETGYYTYSKDKKKNEEKEIFLPFEKMEYVLIGIDYQLIPQYRAGKSVPSLVPHRVAKLMFNGKSSSGHSEVLSFSIGNRETLNDWIEFIKANHVTIFHTDMALGATPNNPEGLQAVPKRLYEGSLLFEPGTKAEDMENIFYNEKQKMAIEKKEKIRRKRGIYFTFLLAILQIIMICLWFPSWDIDGSSFSDDSDESIAAVMTLLSLFFIYIYMRRVRWYDPIKDLFIIGAGIQIGVLFTPAAHPTFPSAVWEYAFTIFLIFFFVVYLFKWFGWIKKRKKKDKNVDSNL